MKTKNESNDRNSDRDNLSLGTRLKGLIGERTIREAAKDWGVNPSSLMNYLYKDSMPSAEIAYTIAKNEGVTVEWLLIGGESNKDQDTPMHSILNDESSYKNQEVALLSMLTNERLTELTRRIEDDGINSVLIDRKLLNIVKMLDGLKDEAIKEILLLINEAQYCSLVGLEFKPTSNKQKDRKISNG
jgi:transcriptional regulator with XRE-family HTH domain